MNFKDFFNGLLKETRQDKGTYVAVQWPESVAKEITDTAKEFGVPNVLDDKDIHTTLIYSRVGFDHTPSKDNFGFSTIGPNNSRESMLVVFDGKILALKLYSKQLEERHQQIMLNNPKATYDFPKYIPHITLSYDIEDYDISNFDYEQFSERLEDASGGIEYTEPLDLDWAK